MYVAGHGGDNDGTMGADRPFLELKRYPDGAEMAYDCSLVAYDGRAAAVRYVYEREAVWHEHRLPVGGRTYAWYWRGRRYLLYRMYGPDGDHIVDRFDVVDRLRLRRDGVEFRDLYLDVWIDGAGVARLDDERELAEAVAGGLLTPDEAAAAHRTARLLLRGQARLIGEAERWLAAQPCGSSLPS